MKETTTWERFEIMRKAMGYKREGEFGALSGASKAVVSQWKSGLIKTIGPEYAYEFEKNTGFSAKWIQTGQEPQKVSVPTEFGHLPVATYALIEDIAEAGLSEEDILRVHDLVTRLSGKPRPVVHQNKISQPATVRQVGPQTKQPTVRKIRIHK